MMRRFNQGIDMRGTGLRSNVKSVVAILCAASFLTVSMGSVTRAVAADPFEAWPKKTTEPGIEPKPATNSTGAAETGKFDTWPSKKTEPGVSPAPATNGAAQAGEAAGTKAGTGLSSGTIGWIAGGAAVIIGIAVAAGGGGGGGSSSNH